MTTPVSNIYQQYQDLDGQPLENGYIYIGTANENPETSPIAVYSDQAATQPAAQPLRTSNGFVYRSGTPTNIFVNTNYSITVRNQQRELVFTAPSAASASGAGTGSFTNVTITNTLTVNGDTILGDTLTGGSTTVHLGTGDTFLVTNLAGDNIIEVTEAGSTNVTVPSGEAFTVDGDGDFIVNTPAHFNNDLFLGDTNILDLINAATGANGGFSSLNLQCQNNPGTPLQITMIPSWCGLQLY